MVHGKRLPAGRARVALVLFVSVTAIMLVSPGVLRAEAVTITNVFDSEDIINVFRDISAQTGINILAEPSVQGWITLELMEVPLEEALDMIVVPLGYTWVRVR